MTAISIHALLAESDLKTPCVKLSIEVFLSTLSLRRATQTYYCENTPQINFYPRSPCGERPRLQTTASPISNFYPRSPCGERHFCHCIPAEEFQFLSTLSLRRATVISARRDAPQKFLSTLSLRRATRFAQIPEVHFRFLSTLSLRRATAEWRLYIKLRRFLSTLSLRRATRGAEMVFLGLRISIHALLAESDLHVRGQRHENTDFYPRSPCGERRSKALA